MKKAIALSCVCFLLSACFSSCGSKNKNDSGAQDTGKTTTVTTTRVTTSRPVTTSGTSVTTDVSRTTAHSAVTDHNSGNVSDHGVMPDESSPLEKIPDAIGTAAEGIGDTVSEVIDDLT